MVEYAGARLSADARRGGRSSWEIAAALVGVVATVVAVVVTLRAGFLAYPGWLALQKADLILGPIGVGLYWRQRRPESRFGALLIVVGLLQIPYILESSSDSAFFTVGLYWEAVVFLCTYALILGFPSGKLRLVPEGLILLFAALGPEALSTAATLLSSHSSPGGSISACRTVCPQNALVIRDDLQLALRLTTVARWLTVALAASTAALLVWRLVTGSPPRRRAFAIGTPIALVFLASQILNQLARLYDAPDSAFFNSMRWTILITRSLTWYGFLFALIAAQLFAGRVLRRMVGESLRRPTLRELEGLLRAPLGDPGLRLAFWQPEQRIWIDGQGDVIEPPRPHSGRELTEVEREGWPAAAIVHDEQLSDDPELLQAAGATALLARENAELQAAWNAALDELRDSRTRIAAAADQERHNLERDLHDGAQQSLVALRIHLGIATDQAAGDPQLHRRLRVLGDNLDDAIDELRDIAHGIYPEMLADEGLVRALEFVAQRATRRIDLETTGVGRYPTAVETGVYYCCREALQNVEKHAGPTAAVTIHLRDDGHDLTFEVRDDGVGFDTTTSDGAGLRNMQDRMAPLDGNLTIASQPEHGTVVSGAVPLRN